MEPDQPKGLGSCPSPCPRCLSLCSVLGCSGVHGVWWAPLPTMFVLQPYVLPMHQGMQDCTILGLPESLAKGSWRHVGSVGFEHRGVQDRTLHWDLWWSHGSWRASGGGGTWELTAARAPHMEWWPEDAAGSRCRCQAPLSTKGWW